MSPSSSSTALGTLWEVVRGHQAEQKLCMRIADEHVLDETTQSNPFVQDTDYFGIRLSEMFIRDARVFLRSFVPLTVAVTEFIYDGNRVILPFIVGKQILKSIEQYVSGEAVEYKNTNIAGPIPYMGGPVSLFIGLYRTQVSDISKKLFGLLTGILSKFDASGLTRYLDIAAPLSAGLSDLLGMREVEFLLGKRDEFGGGEGPSQFKSGYLVYLNCDAHQLNGQSLYVKNDSLAVQSRNGQVERFRAHDYCLVRIEQFAERSDYTALPFHRLWVNAKDLIWEDQAEKAKGAFITLVQELAHSADLTKKHRYLLLQAYKANFEIELQTQQSTITFRTGNDEERVRGESRQLKTAARNAMQAAAFCASTAQLKDQEKTFAELSRNFEKIPALDRRTRETRLTDQMLTSQLKQLEKINPTVRPNVDDLASILTKAAFQTQAR